MSSVRVAQGEELVGVRVGCGSLVSLPKAEVMGMFSDWLIHPSILWVAVFGVFGKIYIHAKPVDGGVRRMKNAVWVDLVNMLLWFLTTMVSMVAFLTMRGGRSLHTGRAAV